MAQDEADNDDGVRDENRLAELDFPKMRKQACVEAIRTFDPTANVDGTLASLKFKGIRLQGAWNALWRAGWRVRELPMLWSPSV